jgi:sec-independent protein translocase protein TatA
MLHPVIGWGFPSGGEWIIVAIVAVLLFGKRLPEVGKSLGKGIVEFKKGLRGIEEDVDAGVNNNATAAPTAATPAATAPRALPSEYKFDPLTGKPLETAEPKSAPQQTVAREKPKHRFDPYTGEKIGAGEEQG